MNQMDKHLKALLKGLTVGGGDSKVRGWVWRGEEKSQGTVHSQSVKMCNACTWLRVG